MGLGESCGRWCVCAYVHVLGVGGGVGGGVVGAAGARL